MSNSILLYVKDAAASGRYYERILGQKPVEASPTFVIFVLKSGLGLGLWGRDGVEPAPSVPGGGSEIGFKVDSAAEVDQWHAEWRANGAAILMPPTELDFGRSFVAADPDGHRLRVYTVTDGG
ncbi:drug:proton antiporter [Shinella sp. WSJ-2]|uniref:VOC family protein n=1 Tax=Shinella sp. WSJ-2 TaxID=2303749 RepID=UPI000E3D5F11|nr:VOC family protein [Shinella sp. WSJ-2]RFZ86900.1 drug:proton antiporter [Shinella sp. WSJ-2]